MRILAPVLAAAVAVLAACKGREDARTPPPTPTPHPTPVARGTTPLGVRWERLAAGQGAPPAEGQRVRLRVRTSLPDGTTDEGEIAFSVGDARTLPGLDEIVRDMGRGERRLLEVPPAAAFGSDAPAPIPPDTPLRIEVELLAIETP